MVNFNDLQIQSEASYLKGMSKSVICAIWKHIMILYQYIQIYFNVKVTQSDKMNNLIWPVLVWFRY